MRQFALSYVKGGTAEKSALEAGYAKTYAHSKSGKLLNHPEIIAEIKRLRVRMDQQADKAAVDVVNEFSKVAFTDRTTFLKPDPDFPGQFCYKAPDELTDKQKACVEKVTPINRKKDIFDDNGVRMSSFYREEYKYIFSDKVNALTQMGRHFGIFDDKLKLGVSSQNPFTNVSQEQLAQLKESWVKTMNDPKLLTVDGEFTEVLNGS